MKGNRLVIMATIVAGFVFGVTPGVWAVGGPAGDTPCCQVINPGAGAIALKGTLAIVYDPLNFNLDVILRLERSKTIKFFRLNLNGSGANISGKTNEEIACLIFNPHESPVTDIQTRVLAFVDSIVREFFAGANPSNTRLVITAGSISNMQGWVECSSDGNLPDLCLIPGTGRVSTMGDIVIYAVDPARVRLENPGCPAN